MVGADEFKRYCASIETLQERMRSFDDADALQAVLHAVGAPDPESLLDELLSMHVERLQGYVFVPVAWDAGDLAAYRGNDRDEVSLYALDARLLGDAGVRSVLFQAAGSVFESYLGLWADELNRRGDELYERESERSGLKKDSRDGEQADCAEAEVLTRGTARILASLKCSNGLAIDCMQPDELLGIPLVATDASDEACRSALLSAAASVADILLHGTWIERLRAELTDSEEEGPSDNIAPDRGDEEGGAIEFQFPVLRDIGRAEVNGQRFHPDLEARELGAALYLNRLDMS